VGCGGGILTEGLARLGADALGIDLSEELIDIADLHGLESGVNAHYQKISAEALALQQPESFDHVTCMEMLEHCLIRVQSFLLALPGKTGGMVFFFHAQPQTQSLFVGHSCSGACSANAA